MPLLSAALHVQLMLTLILLTLFACGLAVVCGALFRRVSSNYLPPVPPVAGWNFPNQFDLGYTLFYTLLTVLSVISTLSREGLVSEGEISAGTMLYSTLAQSLFYLPFLIRIARLPKIPRPKTKLFYHIQLILLALGGIIVPFLLLENSGILRYIQDATNCPEFQTVVLLFRDGDTALKLAVAGAAVIMAPLCEEVVYRGFVYRILKLYTGRVLAVILSAMLFSVIHGALVQALPLFIFGVVQCLVYEKARTLWVPILVHMIYNSLTLLYLLYS